MTVPVPGAMNVSWHGVRVAARHELRLRILTRRWRWLLATWFGTLLVFTGLLRAALQTADNPRIGTPMFGGLMLFLLGLGLVVMPALMSQSAHGDRERGVSPAGIALGRLLAAWVTTAVFVLVSVPMVGWAMVEGGVGFVQATVALGVVAIVLGFVCTLAQCFSAIFVRGVPTAVVSYLVVFTLSVLTVIGFGLAASASTQEVEHDYPYQACAGSSTSDSRHPDQCVNPDGSISPAQSRTQKLVSRRPNLNHLWWLLAPNPFVILADATPAAPHYRDDSGHLVANSLDPLAAIAQSVESTRHRPDSAGSSRAALPTWSAGLAIYVLIGALAVATTIHRSRGVRSA